MIKNNTIFFVFLLTFLVLCKSILPSERKIVLQPFSYHIERKESSIAKQISQSSWWEGAIFYQIFPRSFQDTNGDGNGDFRGITSRLDYLFRLGITAIWLTPMFEAPSYHGYDYQDFYTIESDYGTMQDFENFLSEAKKHNIKVILDLVLNHISIQHEWFQKSCASENGDSDPSNDNEYKDYFIWKKEIPQGTWGKPWASPDHPDWGYNQPKTVWIWNNTRQAYYYAAFSKTQPDLNLLHSSVVTELKKMAKFWLDKGIHGFRFDAIRYLIEEGPYPLQSDTDSSVAFLCDFKKYIKTIFPEALLIGEAWSDRKTIAKYKDTMDLCFDFPFGDTIVKTLKSSEIKALLPAFIKSEKEKILQDAPKNFYAPFLRNHDQNRVGWELESDLNKMKLAALLLLTAEGVPYLYYGEEIGMTQKEKGDDIFKRAPMQWDTTEYAGFTSGKSVWVEEAAWFPWRKNHQPWWKKFWDAQNKKSSSVEGQWEEEKSLLNFYKNLIALRKKHPEFHCFANASIEFFETGNENILAFRRVSEKDETIFFLNCSPDTQEITNVF